MSVENLPETVTLINHRPTEFIVNIPDSDYKKIVVKGAKSRPTKIEVPLEVFEHLAYDTSTFETGSLSFEHASKAVVKELKENMNNLEAYESNALSKKDIKELLKGNTATMKKRLEKITDLLAQKAVVGYISENINEIPFAKVNAICEWAGVSPESLKK